MGRRSDLVLTRRAIAVSALRILDDEGTEALTMRRLADALDVKSASLYNHVQSKDSIIAAVGELIGAEMDLSLLAHEDWRQGLKDFARSYRRAYLDHPAATALMASRSTDPSRGALAGYDAMLARLHRGGVNERSALELIAALDYLVLGSTLVPHNVGFDLPVEEYGNEGYYALARSLATLERDAINEISFETALDVLLRGWPLET